MTLSTRLSVSLFFVVVSFAAGVGQIEVQQVRADTRTGCIDYWVHFINRYPQTVNVAYLDQPDNASGTRLSKTFTRNQDIAVGCGQPMTGLGSGPHHSYNIQSVTDLQGKLLTTSTPPPATSSSAGGAEPDFPTPNHGPWPPWWFNPKVKSWGSSSDWVGGAPELKERCNLLMTISIPLGKRVGDSVSVTFDMGPRGLAGPYANIFSSGEIDWGDETPREPFDLIFSEYKPFQRLKSFTQTKTHTYAEAGDFHVSAFMGGDFKDLPGSYGCRAQRWELIHIDP